MKKILSLFLLIFSIDVTAQTLNLKIKGVEIGTNYQNVIRKLGNPLSIKKGGIYPCDNNGKMLTMKYAGLKLQLIESNLKKEFIVASAVVTSNKWSVSGIKIGADINQVESTFGKSELIREKGFDTLNYFNGDGYAAFYFQNKKLVKISWELNIC